ncbi:hypothetical protein BASA60_001371 [Batrachochytrium salamandrivorans]|nr:hypothetical protein BASA60_001371 [Batrachochytrium salamandrivorans]
MRLISFAMVSLLAITVSALPPHNPDTDAIDKYLDDAIQDMDQSPSISAEDMEGLMEFDTEMLDQLLNDAVQNAQQPQGAATQNAQQSPGATSQDLDQSLDYILWDIREFQGISAQEMDEVLGATSQDLEHIWMLLHRIYMNFRVFLHRRIYRSLSILLPQMLESFLDAAQSAQQSPDAATQDIHEFQGISAQEVDEVLDATAQSAQQSFGDATHDTPRFPDASTQSTQQPQYTATWKLQQFMDAATQSAQQSPDAATQDIHEFQGISAQEVDEVLDATTQSAQQSPDADYPGYTEVSVYCYPDEVDEVLDATTQSAQQSPDAAIQDIQKSQYTATQMLESFLDAAQSAQQSDQNKVLVEMNRLTEALKIQADRCFQMDLQINTEKQRDTEVKNIKYRIASQLRRTVGLSPNSCYNMGILLSQYDKALKDIDTSLVEQQTIDNAISVFDNDALKAKRKQLENEIQDLRSYSKIAKEILRQHGHSQPIYM